MERFELDKCIPVESRSGVKYLIKKGFQQNIYRLDENGKEVERLCAHIGLEYGCPTYDHMLAQKLFLECSEEEFLGKANKQLTGQYGVLRSATY